MTFASDKKSFGKPALTYIAGKNLERKLGRALAIEKHSRATLWGKFLEQRVHDLLPTSYELLSNVTVQHPIIKCWVGSPDNIDEKASVVCDTKCYEPQNFAEYVDTILKNDVELFKMNHPEEYWQLISNAVILDAKYIEPIVYMPYEDELPDIRLAAGNYDGEEQYRFRFIAEAPKCELPYLPDNGYYKNLNIVRFEAPLDDSLLLTERILEAQKLLTPLT